MKLDISIIIPCYNCQETLEEAVASCFVQGLDNFEIVMVDDGSTDKTKDVMQKLAEKHSEIKLFYHEKNRGGGATRNTAVKNSRADIIFCLDSDDILPENTLSKMFNFLKEKNCDGVGIHKSIKFIGKDIKKIDVVHVFGYSGERIPLDALFQKQDIFCPLYSTFMFTKKAFRVAGGYPVEHGFDTQGFAWRFLSKGLIAYTCPETSYLHRVRFKESYYLREANAGKVNYNWRDIFFEHLALFDKSTQDFIKSFNPKDFTKNFFEEVKKRENIFNPNYKNIIGVNFPKGKIPEGQGIYMQRNSLCGVLLRIFSNIKKNIKKNKNLYKLTVFIYAFLFRIKRLLTENKERKAYYQKIEEIKNSKKIVVDLVFGGIGDCLVYSTLPRLLKEKYDVDFYLSQRSLDVIRKQDIFTLCFKSNPFFKGIMDTENVFTVKIFEREKSFFAFLTDKKGKTVLETLEKQFNVEGNGYPELYYKPKKLSKYSNIILIDKNMISGDRFGWRYKNNAFENEALLHKTAHDDIEYVDTNKQDLFTYVDMIYSCKYFVCTFSGGASIASCFNKNFSVLWPYNAINSSNYNFCYTKSRAVYIK